ncbi:MAG: HAMP domain-containing histidine kinase [Lachnospiraceae bacterium]|nr:HAMP domain-containing histidine kinase [Lachnospiraceae bacterium]
MRFRTRLIVSFCIIIFLPILLAIALIFSAQKIQQNLDGRSFLISDDGIYLANSYELLSNYTETEYETLRDWATSHVEWMSDVERLDEMNDGLIEKYSYLMICRGDKVVYDGTRSDQLHIQVEDLPRFGAGSIGDGLAGYYYDGQMVLMKQVDFFFDGGGQGRAFIVTTTREVLPEVRNLMWDLVGSVLLILIFTGAVLITWTYSGLVPNTRRLMRATNQIREGNLDEPIDIHGNDEIAVLAKSIEEMRLRLQADAKDKIQDENVQKQLISNIAHDLKTPLTAIRGYAEGLLEGVATTPEKQEAYLRTIYSKANEMNTLLNELSLYSKIDTNRIPYDFQHIPVRGFFNDCTEDLAIDLENQGMHLSYQCFVDDSVEMIADPEQLMRVIHNIIGNAVKYHGEDPLFISFRVKDVGDFVQIEVEDNGMGISSQDLPHIFDRMFRSDASRNSAVGGSGIGLSIVKKIIEDHGGQIWATSKEHVGTVMYFVLHKYQEVVNEQ